MCVCVSLNVLDSDSGNTGESLRVSPKAASDLLCLHLIVFEFWVTGATSDTRICCFTTKRPAATPANLKRRISGEHLQLEITAALHIYSVSSYFTCMNMHKVSITIPENLTETGFGQKINTI